MMADSYRNWQESLEEIRDEMANERNAIPEETNTDLLKLATMDLAIAHVSNTVRRMDEMMELGRWHQRGGDG